MLSRLLLLAATLILCASPAVALDNGVGRTPAMGWDAWNSFACKVSEDLIEKTADALVKSGMRDAGYKYLVLDDCWMDGRNPDGSLRANPVTFSHGMKALGDYIHARGLKYGIYETPNTVTCANIWNGYKQGLGSLGHEAQDAQTFASWGVDYLKYDHCDGDFRSFAIMRDALRKTGRPILYSINPEFGDYPVVAQLPDLANSARVAEDVGPTWNSVMRVIDTGANWAMYARPGYFNDFDMLEVGNGMTESEDRAHFSMWCMLASPLLAGNDVTAMSPQTLAILTNRELVAIDQDSLGAQATLKDEPTPTTQVWTRRLAKPGTWAVALLNRGTTEARIPIRWNRHLGIYGKAFVRDLWAHKDLGVFNKNFTATVPPHDVVVVKVNYVDVPKIPGMDVPVPLRK